MPKAAAPCNQQQKQQQLIQSFAVSPVPQYVHCISLQEDSALPLFMNYSADFQLVKSRRKKKKNKPCHALEILQLQSDSFSLCLTGFLVLTHLHNFHLQQAFKLVSVTSV